MTTIAHLKDVENRLEQMIEHAKKRTMKVADIKQAAFDLAEMSGVTGAALQRLLSCARYRRTYVRVKEELIGALNAIRAEISKLEASCQGPKEEGAIQYKNAVYQQFIERIKGQGGNLLAFTTPCCNQLMETPAAPEGDQWDSLSSCPHCDALYMKIVTHDAAVGVIPEGEE